MVEDDVGEGGVEVGVRGQGGEGLLGGGALERVQRVEGQLEVLEDGGLHDNVLEIL